MCLAHSGTYGFTLDAPDVDNSFFDGEAEGEARPVSSPLPRFGEETPPTALCIPSEMPPSTFDPRLLAFVFQSCMRRRRHADRANVVMAKFASETEEQ